jgi:Tfp pilus assembly protein PilV
VTATAVIGLGHGRSSRLVAKLRGEEGIGLIELLIALLVLNVGIFATLGAFTSAATAIDRASHISTASAISDKYMECFRDSPYANIQWAVGAPCYATTTTGPDGRTYNLSATVVAGSQYSGTYSGSTSVKTVTLTITDPKDHNRVLVTSSSTFSRCTQSGMGSDPTACQS